MAIYQVSTVSTNQIPAGFGNDCKVAFSDLRYIYSLVTNYCKASTVSYQFPLGMRNEGKRGKCLVEKI